MAEKFDLRSTKTHHESNTLAYGTFGTASYVKDAQKWTFLRREIGYNSEKEDPEQSCEVEILTDPEVIIDNISSSPQVTGESSLGDLDTDILAALPFLGLKKDDGHHVSTNSSWFSLGSALWLSSDGIDSGNLTVPVSAYVVGNHKRYLRVHCYGRQTLDRYVFQDSDSAIQIPRILSGASGSWSNDQTIEQVVFSRQDKSSSNGSFLAVRHTSGTSIFQPLLRKGAPDVPSSLLDVNLLVTIPSTSTGGSQHSDVSFAPHDQHVVVIVDIQGNWSTWKVDGRRSKTTRALYQTRLLASGKLFFWENRQRPADIQLYMDGWHKVLWISDDTSDDCLLVCNRYQAKVFNIATGAELPVDLRLDAKKRDSSILDATSGPKSGTYIILTTERILLYGFTQSCWKSSQRPALLCAWLHDRSPQDLTLKLTTIWLRGGFKLVLYSGESTLTTMYDTQSSSNDPLSPIRSSLSVTLPLARPSNSAISSITFARCEASTRSTQFRNTYDLLQIIMQYQDLTIVTFLASHRPQGTTKVGETANLMHLPPSRSLAHHSERYIHDSEDDSDDSDWVIHTQKDLELEFKADLGSESKHAVLASQQFLTRSFESLSDLIDSTESFGRKRDATELTQLLHRTAAELHGLRSSNHAVLMIDALEPNWHIEDIDEAAVAIREIEDDAAGKNANWYVIEESRSDERLQMPTLYELYFRTYIGRLPPAIPSRTRMRRERNVREVSFELSLSSLVRSVPNSAMRKFSPDLEDFQPNSQILSDPIPSPEQDTSTKRPTTSASQPEYCKSTLSYDSELGANSPRSHSFIDAIARLSGFAKIRNLTFVRSLTDEAVFRGLDSLLAHIPMELDSHPDDYDWQAHEISDLTHKDASGDTQSAIALRRREKLARTQRRAEALLPKNGDYIPQISSTIALSSSAILPIRNSTDAPREQIVNHHNFEQRPATSQPAVSMILSDGIIPTEGFIQTQEVPGQISATQPIRGAFAGRTDLSAAGRAKRKRRAGF